MLVWIPVLGIHTGTFLIC